MIYSVVAFLPEILLICSIFVLLIRGVYRERKSATEPPFSKAMLHGMRAGTVALLCSFFYIMWRSPRFHGMHFGGCMMIDHLALFGKVIILSFGTLWAGFRFRFMSESLERHGLTAFEYPILFLLSLLGGCLLLSSHGMMTAYLSLELQMLPLFVVIALRKDVAISLEASFKYFVLSVLASIFILYGTGLIYGFAGTTHFRALSYVLQYTPRDAGMFLWFQSGVIFILMGFLFKLSIVPFHAWAPDVYEGSTNTQVPFLATIPKVTALFFLIRLWSEPFSGSIPIEGLLSWLGIGSILIGSFMSLRQENIRRLMAYGSIAQMGFVLLGISLDNFNSLSASVLHLIIYLVAMNGFFLGLNTLKREDHEMNTVSDLRGLWEKSRFTAVMLAVMLLSLAGIPPFAGFWTKLYLLLVTVKGGLYGQAICALLGTLLAFYYYLRLIRACFFDADPTGGLVYSRHCRVLLLVFAFFLIGFFAVQERLFAIVGGLF